MMLVDDYGTETTNLFPKNYINFQKVTQLWDIVHY